MVKDGQTTIEVSACPYSNDVIGLQDLYLQLDISNSLFETVVDEIASGLDPSGSNYITSSSYANGSLVRAGGRNSDVTTTNRSSVPSTSSTSAASSFSASSGTSAGSGSGSSY